MENIPIRHIEATRTEPELTGNFVIRDVQKMLDGKTMVQELHRHDFFFMLLLEKGSGHHEIDFKGFDIGERNFFLMRPGQVHQLTLNAGSSGYLLQFEADYLGNAHSSGRELLRKVSHLNFCAPAAAGFDKMYSALSRVHCEYTDKLEGYQEAIKLNLSLLFIELARHRQNSGAKPAEARTYPQEKLEHFMELLEKNIATHKQVSDYAGMLHFSTYQLSAITKTLLGKTPSALINEQILLEAKRQLLATSKQVNQIAWDLGYQDASYFARFFKNHTGASPEAFRQKSR